ncbi:uncharacterized protein [Littorina saxatilis]|uniref:Centromere protein Q n=1 Tax=Littorina saxatilis TaxID=31220 RepID=A0AAN9FX27_9CAEN
MPARQSNPKDKKGGRAKNPPGARTAAGRTRLRSRSTVVNPSWKPVAKHTKNYALNTFDSGIRLLMNKVPEGVYEEVHDALSDARNQVAVSLETLRVPPNKQDYDHLSTTLVNLKQTKAQLSQRYKSLSKALDKQEKELQKMEDEKISLQDFGKLPGKHHPLLLEPLENDLHLNFSTVK